MKQNLIKAIREKNGDELRKTLHPWTKAQVLEIDL